MQYEIFYFPECFFKIALENDKKNGISMEMFWNQRKTYHFLDKEQDEKHFMNHKNNVVIAETILVCSDDSLNLDNSRDFFYFLVKVCV